MKKAKKRCLALILAALMLVALAGCGDSGTDDQINIKIGTTSSENAIVSQALLVFQQEVNEKSNGRMNVQLYFGGQIGTEQEMLELTRIGDIEMATSAHLNISGSITELTALESYFMFDDYEHAFRFMESPGGQAMLDAYQQMDVQGMAFFPTGFRQFTNDKRAIETLEDLQGIKIRGYSTVQIAAWESLGVNLTAVTWNELFTSLQQNLVDGQESALSSIYEQKFYEVQDYISLTYHSIGSDILICNQEWFDSLSDEDQEIINEALATAVEHHRELLTTQEDFYLQTFEDYGCEINEVSIEVREEMRELVNEVVTPEIIELAGQETYDLVQEWVEATRE